MFRYVAAAALMMVLLSSPVSAKCYECCGGNMPDGSCIRWCQIVCGSGPHPPIRSAKQCPTSDQDACVRGVVSRFFNEMQHSMRPKEAVKVRQPDHLRNSGFCGGLLCPDGSSAYGDGLSCLCKAKRRCRFHELDCRPSLIRLAGP